MKMNQQRLASSLLALCFLVCISPALGCDWDQFNNQGLDPADLTTGAVRLKQLNVSDLERCLADCCNKSCNLVLVDPAHGGPQCTLVWCQDRNQCRLMSRDQMKVYRKRDSTETKTEDQTETEREDGKSLRIVPLLGASEPGSNETNSFRCRLPMKVGSCRAAFTKFFYNVTKRSCQSFIFGGCEANDNNFNSQQECEAACTGVTGSVLPVDSTPAPPPPVKAARMAPAVRTNEPEPAATEAVHTQETGMAAEDFAERCGADPQVGPCRAAFQRWYYNTQTGSCQSFIYGGCRGNNNNYLTPESCMATCTVTVLPSSKKLASYDEVSAEFRDQCMMAPDPGTCRAAFPMFYYDPDSGSCQSFIYGGCKGNQNRYGSEVECMNRCSTDGVFEGRGKVRDRWTAAVFLFVTLAAISALLLAALIVITLRRRGLYRRPSSLSDKEELLPEEQSSVDSLNVPESPKPDKA